MYSLFVQEGAIYSNGKEEAICGWGPRIWREQPQGFSWYFPDYFLRNTTPFFSQQTKRTPLGDLKVKGNSATLSWQEGDFTAFESAWQALKTLNKVVPYAELSTPFPLDPMSVLEKAIAYHQKTPGTTLYGFWGADGGMIGVTPELLCRVEEEKIHTVACAGTSPDAAVLLNNPKLLDEHQWVIEGIRQSLAPFGSSFVGPTEEKRFGKLFHLVTAIHSTFNESGSFLDIVRALHPTPALGAYPQKEGMDWLKDFESKVPRGRFGAPAGYFDPETEKGECIVAIRNVQWNPLRSSIFCGAGITSASNVEAEKAEVCLKWQAVREIIGC